MAKLLLLFLVLIPGAATFTLDASSFISQSLGTFIEAEEEEDIAITEQTTQVPEADNAVVEQTTQEPEQATQESQTDGGLPPVSIQSGRLSANIALSTAKQNVENGLKDLEERLAKLEQYFEGNGILVLEETTTAAPASFGKRMGSSEFQSQLRRSKQTTVDARVEQVGGRADALKAAVEAFKQSLIPRYTEGEDTDFYDREYVGYFDREALTGTSGIAHSRIHSDIIYAITDQSEDNFVYLVNSTTGRYISKFKVSGSYNDDWEDVAVGPCDEDHLQDSCIFVGDIGKSSTKWVYIVDEPTDIHVAVMEYRDVIEFEYDEVGGMESLMVTPNSTILAFTEEENPVLLDVRKGQWVDCGTFKTDKDGPVAADMSADGTMVVVKVIEYVYFYYLENGDYSKMCDDSKQHKVTYTEEEDGQSIAFSPDAMSFYTTSEKQYQALWRYDRLQL